MIRFTLKNLQDRVPQRKPGYLEAVLALATKSGDDFLLSPEDHQRIRRKFSLPPPVPVRSNIPPVYSGIPQPGDIFGLVIYKITGQRTASCGLCGQRKRKMNEWGWWGCWKNRKTIVGWMIDEAQKRGHNIDESGMLGLFKAAFREQRLTGRTR